MEDIFENVESVPSSVPPQITGPAAEDNSSSNISALGIVLLTMNMNFSLIY